MHRRCARLRWRFEEFLRWREPCCCGSGFSRETSLSPLTLSGGKRGLFFPEWQQGSGVLQQQEEQQQQLIDYNCPWRVPVRSIVGGARSHGLIQSERGARDRGCSIAEHRRVGEEKREWKKWTGRETAKQADRQTDRDTLFSPLSAACTYIFIYFVVLNCLEQRRSNEETQEKARVEKQTVWHDFHRRISRRPRLSVDYIIIRASRPFFIEHRQTDLSVEVEMGRIIRRVYRIYAAWEGCSSPCEAADVLFVDRLLVESAAELISADDDGCSTIITLL